MSIPSSHKKSYHILSCKGNKDQKQRHRLCSPLHHQNLRVQEKRKVTSLLWVPSGAAAVTDQSCKGGAQT